MNQPWRGVDFGSRAGENDIVESHPELFVATAHYQTYSQPKKQIVIGRKGSGKTVLWRTAGRLLSGTHWQLVRVDANRLDFGGFFRAFSEPSTPQFEHEVLRTVTKIWEHVVLVDCMRTTVRHAVGRDADKIQEYLESAGYLNREIQDVLYQAISRFSTLLLGDRSKAVSGLFEDLRGFGSSAYAYDAAIEAMKRILKSEGPLLFTFDRLDAYFAARPPARETFSQERDAMRVIIGGLVQAVYNIHTSDAGEYIRFKVFFPQDKFSTLNLRDLDKITDIATELRWRPPELREFIAKRIAFSLKLTTPDGTLSMDPGSTWYQVFERSVDNEVVGGHPEEVSEYLIRHSHWKPRDLQIYCDKAKEIMTTEGRSDPVIPQDVIRRAVAASTRELVENTLREYSYEFPYIERVIQRFAELKNIQTWQNEFFPALKRVSGELHPRVPPKEIAQLLYRIGAIGCVTSSTNHGYLHAPTRKARGRVYAFIFSHLDPDFDILGAHQVAFHPMFNEYLRLEGDKEIIVG